MLAACFATSTGGRIASFTTNVVKRSRVVSAARYGMSVNGSMIHARGLVKRFGDLVAVDGIDLDVRAGEAFGFLGPNGAGKTTTLKAIMGLVKARSGAITLGATDLLRISPDEIPLTESLKDTVERFLPYWHEVIAPSIRGTVWSGATAGP